ncbi:MAG: hypothetical protein ABUL47_08440 [Leifsonia sp.]
MSSNRRRIPLIALAGALALSAPLMLSGCSLVHPPGSHSTGITIPGVGSAGSGKLPSDYPTNDVPVISGDVVSGVSLGTGAQEAWSVSIKVSGVDAFDDIASQLTGAGFTQQVGGKTADGATGLFTKTGYAVEVLLGKSDDKSGYVANYTVTQSEDNN